MLGHILRRWRRRRDSIRPTKSLRRRTTFFDHLEARTLLAAPEIAVFNGTAEIADDSTVPIDFDNGVQGADGPTLTFTIQNDGDGPLTLRNLNLPAGFSIVENILPQLSPTASLPLTIRLDTSVVGTKSGQISFDNNDDDENPFNFSITGIVLASGPEITVLDGLTSIVDGTSTTIDFGSVIQRQTGPVRTFAVQNDGTAPLSLGQLTLPVGFELVQSLPPSLAPQTFASFGVRLASTSAGFRFGQITLANGDADENPFNFPIAGTVTTTQVPEIAVLDGTTEIADGAAAAIDFGTVYQGQTAPTRTFTVRNAGTAPLALSSVTLPAGFTLVEGLVASLTPLGDDTIIVQLDTTSVGVPAGQISIASNDADENPFNFAIAGTVLAVAPEIRVVREDFLELVDAVTPTTVFTTVVESQTTSTVTFAVLNSGAATLTLGSVTLPAGFSIAEALTASLAPGESDTFTVQLDTTTPGDKAGDIFIENNDGDENPFHIAVMGTVQSAAPEITVLSGTTNIVDGATVPFDFGRAAQGRGSLIQTFTVRNDGTTPLTPGTISLPAGYLLLEGLNSSLAAGQSDSFTVTRGSAFAGTFSGDISIVTNDADENPFNFRVVATITRFTRPEITVLDGATELVATGTIVPIDFGSAIRRQTGPTRTFTIRNDGTERLRIGKIDLPRGFVLVKAPLRVIAAGSFDTIVVQLDTKNAGTRTGRLTINNSDTDERAFSFVIAGTVIA